jgi:transcriptional regulator GlxA family with amidase domain
MGGSNERGELHRVVALVVPGALMLDLAAPTHLFGHCGAGRYAFETAAEVPGPVVTSTGLEVFVRHGLEALESADTVVVAGYLDHGARPSEAVLSALRAVHQRGGRVMSVCTGAFALGFAGLLDGRRSTTHWHECEQLGHQFPATTVDPGVLYVDEGSVLTSAGVASGLDLCLHVVRRDFGAGVAAAFARRSVIAPHRDGGQAQFVVRPVAARGPAALAGAEAASGDGAVRDSRRSGGVGTSRGGGTQPRAAARLEATREWAIGRLAEPLDVATMARHASVSPRTFARRFTEETGTTPNRWLTDQRIAAAQQLLERTDLPVEEVATRSGFGSAASLREHLARRAKTTPTAYRRTFRGA